MAENGRMDGQKKFLLELPTLLADRAFYTHENAAMVKCVIHVNRTQRSSLSEFVLTAKVTTSLHCAAKYCSRTLFKNVAPRFLFLFPNMSFWVISKMIHKTSRLYSF